jgi:hypothetical protein
MSMTTRLKKRTIVGLVFLCGIATIIAIDWRSRARSQAEYVPAPPFIHSQRLYAFSENGVRVELDLERDRNGTIILAGTYTPHDPKIHVYSTDLPRIGINGAGRPTLLEIPRQPSVQSLGPVTANQPVILDHFTTLDTAFPIYPDGPVTLRLPFRLTAQSEDVSVRVLVTYMACSSTGFCLPPVENKPIDLILPSKP